MAIEIILARISFEMRNDILKKLPSAHTDIYLVFGLQMLRIALENV